MNTITKIREEAKKAMVSGLRDCRNMKIGQVVRQGDIYIHRVNDSHIHGELTKNHQLALGVSLGSRHIADDAFDVFEGTTLPKWVMRGHFLGPCIKTKKPTALITHPEHANISLGAGMYQITHQMDIRTMTRVRD